MEAFQRPLAIREYPLPKSLPDGAALVRTEMAGICGTDVHIWKGELPVNLPLIPGHETVGRIERLGAGLELDWNGRPLRVGDRITWTSTASCGHCFYCANVNEPTRCPHRRAYGIGYPCDQPPHFLGGYAEFHFLQPGAHVFRLSDTLKTESVIGAGCALITAFHGIERASIAQGATVVIQGAGPVGISALAVSRTSGAGRILVIGGPPHRLESAKRFGADEVLDLDSAPKAGQRIEWVRERSGGHGADAVLECTGIPAAVPEGMEMCRDGGTYLVMGQYCDAGPVPLNPHIITRKQLRVSGSWSSEPRHMQAALAFLESSGGDFPFDTLVTHRFSIAEANEALKTVASWRSDKAVIAPERGAWNESGLRRA